MEAVYKPTLNSHYIISNNSNQQRLAPLSHIFGQQFLRGWMKYKDI
jgi:hypothetical protein